jgi:uncharacterized membrane protein YdbT with pleckstrin-like domain
MKKINLRVSNLYGIYKQLPYIFLILLLIAIFTFFPLYPLIFFGIGFFLLLRILYGIIFYRNIRIEIFEDRISMREGVFSLSKNFLELYRVKDYEVSQSFFMRIFNLMNVKLHTSDKTSPILDFTGIPKSDVTEIIRNWVEIERKRKGVREFD